MVNRDYKERTNATVPCMGSLWTKGWRVEVLRRFQLGIKEA